MIDVVRVLVFKLKYQLHEADDENDDADPAQQSKNEDNKIPERRGDAWDVVNVLKSSRLTCRAEKGPSAAEVQRKNSGG